MSGRTLSGHLQEHVYKHQSGVIEPGSPGSVKFLQTISTETIILNVKSNWPELGPTVDSQHEIFTPQLPLQSLLTSSLIHHGDTDERSSLSS